MPRILNKKHWPHQTPVDTDELMKSGGWDWDFDEIEFWCRVNFEKRWFRYNNVFCFSEDKDQMLFILRWL
jgi:hypothetical protein